jgi:uncharacterized surface protein with fasciclin (FAS1) repeats
LGAPAESAGETHLIRRLLLSATAATMLAGGAAAADIVDTAIGTGNLAMLMQLIKAAGLTETLRGPGPFTLFAPDDNHAFIEIEDSSLFEELLVDPPRLVAFVSYYIVPGKLMSSDLSFQTLPTMSPNTRIMTLRKEGRIQVYGPHQGGPRINGGYIISGNIEASNGVIHIIDSIIRPPRPDGS